MSKRSHQQYGINKIQIVIYFAVILAIGWTTVNADEVPAFFLKIAKNIPRVGRSDNDAFEKFFLKASKTVPRIGKRDQYSQPSASLVSYNDDDRQGPEKRMINVQAPGNLNAVSWEHFPLAIEGPPELWRTLASYTNDKYGTSSDDIDNEIWRREKRKNMQTI